MPTKLATTVKKINLESNRKNSDITRQFYSLIEIHAKIIRNIYVLKHCWLFLSILAFSKNMAAIHPI